MIWAIKNNQRIKAIPQESAICPLCNQEVIPKCGEIKIWHWAHKANLECDSFGEPETEWHFNWKDMFEKELQEVIIKEHRADIKNKDGLVIEFQNVSISPEQIKEREKFYKNIVWILNGNTIAKNFEWKYRTSFKLKDTSYFFEKGDLQTGILYFDWKWFPKSWSYAKKPIYVDISSWDKDILFQIKFISDGKGYGKRLSKTTFIIENGGKPWLKEGKDGDTKTIAT